MSRDVNPSDNNTDQTATRLIGIVFLDRLVGDTLSAIFFQNIDRKHMVFFVFFANNTKFDRFFSTFELTLHSHMDRKHYLPTADQNQYSTFFFILGKFRSFFLVLPVEASFTHGSKALLIAYCGSKKK